MFFKNPLFTKYSVIKPLNSFIYTYNLINSRNINKPLGLFMKTNKNILLLLNIFKTEGILLYYKYLRTNLLYVRFSYIYYMTFWRKIKLLYKNRFLFSISYKSLTFFIRNSHAILYMSSPKGLYSSSDLHKYRQGGYILFILYN